MTSAPPSIDLNLSNPALAEKAGRLGWGKTVNAAVVAAGKQGQIPHKPLPGIVSIDSPDGELLRIAAASRAVDLVNPLGAKDFYRDDGLIRAVAEAGKAFEIPLAPLLRAEFVYRAKAIVQAREFVRRCLKLGAAFVFTSRAETEWDLKSPRETIALIQLLGLTGQQARHAIGRAPEKVLSGKKQ
ncbi:MAG: hypothetical protein NTY90_03995 [Candidatus Micrarchaeota archaeon]|nr:hypothetical protein [Candidatus Micrarchaeota archaeon]